MSTIIGSGVSISGIIPTNAVYTFNLADTVTANDVGKALTIDTSGSTKLKLAGEDSVITGRLETFENRTSEGLRVGAVSVAGGLKLPKLEATVVTVGQSVAGGATAGTVKAITTPGVNPPNIVTEVGTDYVVVLMR